MSSPLKILLLICFTTCVFIAGFLVGSNSSDISSHSDLSVDNESKTDLSTGNKTQNNNPHEPLAQPSSVQSQPSMAIAGSNTLTNDGNSSYAPSSLSDKRELDRNFNPEDNIIEAFEALMSFAQDNGNYGLYGEKMDVLREVLINDGAALTEMLTYFQELPMESQENYMLLSIMMGLPEAVGQPAIEQILQNALLNESENSERDFLDLVARTGVNTASVTGSVIDIALYGESDETTLRALDVIMPFDLNSAQAEQVRARLQQSVEGNDSEQQAYYFSQLLRFSTQQEREQLVVEEFTKGTPNIAIQSNLMNAVHTGVLDRSDELKQHLTAIAKQEEHPLRQQASYTLLYRFDLNQAEYQDIIRGQDLDLNRF